MSDLKPTDKHSVLIHTGAAKAASTWLQNEFFRNEHSGFFEIIPKSKAIQHLVSPSPLEFSADSCKSVFEPYWQTLTDEKRIPVVTAERFSGASRMGDYDSKEIADRLFSVFPEGRVLYLVREQKSMLLAQYLQYLRRGGTWPLEKFLNPPIKDVAKASYFRWERFRYDRLVEYYQSLFGKERVLVLPMEMLKIDPSGLVRRIREFSGLPADDEALQGFPFRTPANASLSSYTMNWRRRTNWLVSHATSFNPKPLISWNETHDFWKKKGPKLDRLIPQSFKTRHKTEQTRVLKKIVGNYYAFSNAKLAAQTSLDLSAYGYDLPAPQTATP